MAASKELKTDAPFLSRTVRKSLAAMNISSLTEIQKLSIPETLKGRDLLGVANTGSGKTLAFLVPAVEMLRKTKDVKTPRVLVVAPTRELAMQTFRVAKTLLKEVPGTDATLLIGGTRRAHETEDIASGTSILVCTPGRLLDHINSGLSLQKIKMVVLDESDRILDIGFERDMTAILSSLPKARQTLMFSATSTNNSLTKTWLAKDHATIEVKTNDRVTAIGLEQSFVLCPEERRFALLFSLLRRTKEKVIVFFSTCASVMYHGELFMLLKFNVGLLHSGVKQDRRARVFDSFCSGDLQILFSTDVAARGLDVPGISWIVQYDPPTDPKEYVHRVGRTARAGNTGKAILFLLPHEKIFIKYLKQMGVVVEEWEFAEPQNITEHLVKTVSSNYYLEKSARDALKSYLQAYSGHKLKKVFDASKIELNKIANSFGFAKMPNIDLTICASRK
ncbi:ATP-dependent RNA helicase DDX18/HAS1 [Nematocida displodere]|uniref:ATP-dependent RNA helicase n=1 Tax=Nematocida displodere TaxID=1805483 RepID=A0A177EER8_9MICR|nr:ATP-dependent RNA helicase DDX18/HAS1 [Nematocida displodere]